MIFKKKVYRGPSYKEKRTVRKFAWLPVLLDRQIDDDNDRYFKDTYVWLRFYYFDQTYKEGYNGLTWVTDWYSGYRTTK